MGRSKSSKILQWRKKWCRSGIEGWWQSSLWPNPPPRPLSLVTMSVTLMASSCDSIGTCSLDVDAESLADSLMDSAQVDSSLNRRTAGEREANAPSLSKQTLHSLLLSASTNSTGPKSDNAAQSQAALSTSSPSTAKKPSYLNLACSISGYGGITTYDSKLREGFRSRDHSPGKLVGIHNGSREASPARNFSSGPPNSGGYLTAPKPGSVCWTTSPAGGQLPKKSDMKHVSSTIGHGQRINGTNGTDQPDATGNFNVNRMADQRNRWLESTLSPLEKEKDYQNVVSVFESKSDRYGIKTETSIETRYEVNSRSQSTMVSSKTVITSNAVPSQLSSSLQTERVIPISIERNFLTSDRYGHYSEKNQQTFSNGSASHGTPVSTKSFIQQRVERLYGPCALAQGFFHRGSKSPTSKLPTSCEANGVSIQDKLERQPASDKLGSSPELPVLRHLRPEFRDQLAVAPRRSLGSRFSHGSSPTNGSVVNSLNSKIESPQRLMHQTSTESIADLQPAAPEVVLPQQSSSMHVASQNDESSCSTLDSETVVSSIDCKDSKLSSTGIEENLSVSFPAVLSEKTDVEKKAENAGNKFLNLQRQAIEKLLELAKKAENEIDGSGSDGNPILSEEALGHLRAAAGQARLLVTQKMVQFEGLCRKCINQHPDEPFPTTVEDLQGFWDMLLLQVDQVHNTFQHLEKLRAVGWCEEKLSTEGKSKSSESPRPRGANPPGKKTPRVSKLTSSDPAKVSEAAALRKQREDDRRKLMEQRRKELKQKQLKEQQTDASNETVEIFGAQSS